jgi:hypothetical protein
MSEGAPPSSDSYFLSYSRTDGHFALRLAKDVRAAGVAMWVDQLDIRPSEHWDRAIERAVRDCRGMVVILSPRSVASDNVADEISYAIDSGKSVLPVMIERCVLPLRIVRMHVIDATRGYERALQQCLDELRRPDQPVRASVEEPPPCGAPIDREVLSTARGQLTPIVGPIAAILVDKAASRAATVKELYELLQSHIQDDADRERFLATACQPQAPSTPAKPLPPKEASVGGVAISPAELETIATILTRYLGPIAPIVAKRESRASSSFDDLRQRLAALITRPEEQTEFLRRLEQR